MTVGEEIRNARTRRDLSLDALAQTTKVKASVLRALENEDLDGLPPLVYVVGYLRIIASELHLDGDDIVHRYAADLEVERARADAARARTAEARARAAERLRAEEKARAEVAAREKSLAEREARRQAHAAAQAAQAAEAAARRAAAQTAPPRFVLPSSLLTNRWLHSKPLMAAAAVVVVAFTFFAFYPDDERAAPARGGVATAAPAANPGPAATVPAVPPMRIEIVPTKATFVSASTDGQSVVSREMRPGERASFEAQSRFVLRVGDPSAITLTIDAQTARPLGKPGQSVTVQITRETLANFLP
ncbi:MAG TPA: helix-turn-helix domain-containing protein [Vicinamibacterales bacterium]|nr:helix-turn-helix domain-containing protein [Vicinamibacterales bacterium]